MALITAERLCKVIDSELALAEISFEIEEKGIYGFLGKNGAGKSELADLLTGVLEPDSGRLVYKERQMFVNGKLTAQIKKKIGYVPEKCFFDHNMTCMEVLDFIGKAKQIDPDKRFRQIKEAFELTMLNAKRNTLVGDLTLSEKKRLAMAGALLGNPDVVVLDEPLRYLDRAQADEIKKLIVLLGKKKVVLMFGARPDEIEELCTYTAIMAGGQIRLWDKIESVKQKLSAEKSCTLADVLEAFSEYYEEVEQ